MTDSVVSPEHTPSTQPQGPAARANGPVTQDELASQFDENYFRSGCGDVPYSRTNPRWAAFFGMVADELIRALRPRVVLDAGCAMGFLVEAFWDRGVEARGIDISPYAISQVRRDMQPHCRVGSLADGVEGKYDLITCIEVLEHMPEEQAKAAISHLTRATDTLLFSSTPYDFEEPTHFNVRPYISWLQLFQEYGFSPDLDFDASFVAPQAMLLRRRSEPFSVDVLRTFAALLHKRHEQVHRTNQVNELSERVSQLTGEVHARDARLSALQTELQAVQADRNQLAESHAQAQSAVAERDATIVPLRQQISELTERLQSAGRELAESHAGAREHDATIGRLRQEVAEATERLQARERELAAATEAQSSLRAELADADDVITALKDGQEESLSMLLEANHRLNEQQVQDSALARKLEEMDRRFAEQAQKLALLEQRSADAWTMARSVLDSRIWKVLVSGGGVLLRLGGRRPS
jgi:2-polyprenyl-3-methyl-5-hydroxy-6-metoxy-1,4-benzoquinol methylase